MSTLHAKSSSSVCPCRMQSEHEQNYGDCCQRYHDGRENGNPAPTPEALMRSRFSAYVLGLADYLKATWHPDYCPTPLDAEADDQWKQLIILRAKDNTVHFKAVYQEQAHGPFAVLEEVSEFQKLNDEWVYVSGEVKQYTLSPSRNDACPCGSGKKFKKCCGQ